MQIEAFPPFRLSKEGDGSQHAVKDGIQISVLADAGECRINHRCGEKPYGGHKSRWLHAHLVAHGLHVFVNGTHVMITARDYLPGFDLNDPAKLVGECLKYLKIEKNARGAYIIDTEKNRRVLAQLVELAGQAERNRLTAWVKHCIARLTEGR